MAAALMTTPIGITRLCKGCKGEMLLVCETRCAILPDRVRRLFTCTDCGKALGLFLTPFGTETTLNQPAKPHIAE